MLKKLFNIFLLLPALAFSQEALTVEDAIKIALEKNYSVLIARNEKEIAKVQNNIGNAGMSPTISLNASMNFANVDSHQEFSTGTTQDRENAVSSGLNASVNASWMIFDGLRMFAVKKRLDQTEQLSAIQLKAQMENTVYNTILAYYDIVRINALIKAGKYNLSLYEERKNLAKLRMEIGSDSKVDYLLTQSDENKAKSDLLKLEQQLLAAKVNLNTLMVRTVDTDFKVTDSILVNYNPGLDELKQSVLKSNTGILSSVQSEMIATQTIKEARSANLPFVQLNGAYNFTKSQSQAGFLFVNQQQGLNAGVNAGWLIFNGGRNKKLVQERQIRLLNQKMITEQTKQQVDAIVYIHFQNYLTNKKILDLEKENLGASQEVLSISLERYKIGKANLLETKETQRNLEEAQIRFINALYETKRSETELLRSNGSLVK